MPARRAVNRSGSMTSNAIPTVNNPAIPMSAAYAAFFLAHANEKQAKAAALTRAVALYARARRAATGRAACELWGLCARPLCPALTFFLTLTRARGR